MLLGVDSNGVLRNVKVTEDGKIMVELGGSGSNTTIVGNTSENPVPVNGSVSIDNESAIPVSGNVTIANQNAIPVSGTVNVNNIETTLYAGVMTVGLQAQTIGVSKKVTQISIANYSESADVTVEVDNKSYVIGSNIATDLTIGKVVGTVGLSATEADTKVQYVIKGVDA